jgi:hypothetical protein
MKLPRFSLIACLCVVFSSSSVAAVNDSELIEAVKKSNASTLEQGLPDVPILQWVKNTFEHGGNAIWEVNDCGEGGDGREAPTCVEFIIPQKNGYYLHISSVVGETPEQVVTKPHLWMVYFYKAEGYTTLDVININTIAQAIQLYKTNLGTKKK